MRASRKKKAADLRHSAAGASAAAPKAHGPAARPADLDAAEALGNPELAHPANRAPLADLLGQLQRSHGNRYVQGLVADAGHPLDGATRAAMEAAFGMNLGDVRVHTGDIAEQSAESLGARAFTRGEDVYFNQGEYDPTSRAGQELLAHELTHVLQQRRGAAAGPSANQPDDEFEQEAQAAGPVVLAGQRAQLAGRGTAPPIQRQKKKDEAPVIMRHGDWIDASPETGAIDAGGRFSVAYAFTVVKNATTVPLTISVPAGVSVSVTPLTDLGSGDYHVNDPGGAGQRAVTISVNVRKPPAPLIQVTLTKGGFTYIVVFAFPLATPSKSSEPGEPGKPNKPAKP
jgi:hypothetical protein